jgi:hypothetical protein
VDTPPELQKPKAEQALTLVNFQTPEQRLIDQIAVPQDTNCQRRSENGVILAV